ncbi:MAG: LysM peptidoglycan-binding domain-containing protein [Thermoflexus sp.]|uniref:LysM peptidoglycan-binding domain-containing protein n=1 Tax=Thermoflexus sp. TaxID=1969742 RepID=UPI0025E21D6F|nr:LysM peptidoglycan-binding domain-containing protein [Thermoflexus sp.]MCS6963495.1 LysM peptidoglycan-binding domain-containing protein [Thermoflexus sp.]MDW8185078.1 LysM peptidoglycan-binding domain-containing protein [Anaerolineae bacterium]
MRRIGGWLLGGWIGLLLIGMVIGDSVGSGPRVWAQAQVTATPRPDGSIVHTVQEGDTLFGLALLYGTTVEEIKALNGLDSDLLVIGQELLIRPAQPSPAPSTLTPASGERHPGSLCAGAFEDRNGNEMKEEGEPWIAGVAIDLIDGRGWKTTLISEAGRAPCLRDLEPGYYALALENPTGYQASGPTRREIWLPWNTEVTVLFGFQPLSGFVTPTPSPTLAPSTSAGPDLAQLGQGLLAASGFLALLLVGGIIGYLVGQRRARGR